MTPQMSETESPIDSIDPIVRSLLPGYLVRREEELKRLQALLAEGQFEQIRTLGHNLSGSGGAYGLPGLTAIGRQLEAAAGEGDAGAISSQVDALRSYLQQVREQLG